MMEIYSGFVIDWTRKTLEAALPPDVYKRCPVVYSHSQSLDSKIVKERYQSPEEEHKRPLIPFAAVQQTPPPTLLPRAQPNQPGFILAKRYKEEGKFTGAPAVFAAIPYQIRFYLESEPQRFGVVETILLNTPHQGSYGSVRVWFLEDMAVVVGYTIESIDYPRELDSGTVEEMQVHQLLVTLRLEAPVIGKPFPGVLMTRPVIVYEAGGIIEDIRIEYEGG